MGIIVDVGCYYPYWSYRSFLLWQCAPQIDIALILPNFCVRTPCAHLVKKLYECEPMPGRSTNQKVVREKLSDSIISDQARVQLSQENQQLRTLLKQYLDGISVSDEILSHNNPLFIVNNRSNVPWVYCLTYTSLVKSWRPMPLSLCHIW